jgi:hypothetical protein
VYQETIKKIEKENEEVAKKIRLNVTLQEFVGGLGLIIIVILVVARHA